MLRTCNTVRIASLPVLRNDGGGRFAITGEGASAKETRWRDTHKSRGIRGTSVIVNALALTHYLSFIDITGGILLWTKSLKRQPILRGLPRGSRFLLTPRRGKFYTTSSI
ncbi:MAG: hypothetical protein LBM98_02750 [Oscillospiraceae bacterium]|nr:hypothetical protein [Oscillospiraceae bacterium]